VKSGEEICEIKGSRNTADEEWSLLG